MAGQRTTSPFRVLIDLRWMIPGQAGGLETAAYGLMERLLARADVADGALKLSLIVPWELRDRFLDAGPPGIALLSQDSVASDIQRIVHALSGGRFGNRLNAADYDVVFSMTGSLVPECPHVPAVVLVADLQHLVHPQFFTAPELQRRTAASRAVADRARHIVTISEFSRQEIVRLLGVPASRVSCSYLAADPSFDREPTPREREIVLARHGLSEQRFLLLPAQIWPHKNHDRVLAALGRLAGRGRDVPLLVSTGRADSAYARELMARISEGALRDRIRFLGLCPQQDMPALYSGAEALVFCSLYEGFGMPLVEAMRMSCPIVASNTTAVSEVAGDAALLVDPTDVDAIATAVARVLDEPDLRERLVARGRARVEAFSWDRHCNEIVAALYACCGRPEPIAQSTQARLDLRSSRRARTWSGQFRAVAYPRLRRRAAGVLRRWVT